MEQSFDSEVEDLLSDDRPTRSPGDNAAVALDLARRGFRVFPITLKEKGDWTPIVGWQDLASDDCDRVAIWWKQSPEARVGLPCGAANGITVLDIDVKNGKDGLASLAAKGLSLEASPVRVQSPSGGWHLFFTHDPRMKNWAGKAEEKSKLPAGLDCRNTGGFVVAPGSWKGEGQYRPIGAALGSCDLPPFPECLIPPPEPEREEIEPISDPTEEQCEWAVEKLERDAADLAGMTEGEGRNARLNDLAFWAGGAAAHGFLDEDQAREILREASDACGLKHGEFKATFRSGFDAGLKQPISDFPREDETTADEFDDLPPLDDQPKAEPGEAPAAYEFISGASLLATEPERREWLLKDWIPMHTVSLLTGDGGAGKSTAAMQLAACVASSRDDWLGLPTEAHGPTVCYMAEDPLNEIHWRTRNIAAHYGLSNLDDFHVRAAMGDGPLADFDPKKGIRGNKSLRLLTAAIEHYRPRLVVVDTLSVLFPSGANANAQEHAVAFVTLLKVIADKFRCAVVLVAHPSYSGMNSGSGTGGSVGWHNSVRGRIYLEGVKDETGRTVQRDRRVLSQRKVQYGPATETTIPLTFDDRGVLRRETVVDLGARAEAEAGKVFAVIEELSARGEQLHPTARNQPTYIVKRIATQLNRNGEPMEGRQIEAAIARLFDERRIEEADFQRPNRKVSPCGTVVPADPAGVNRPTSEDLLG